MKEVIVYTKTHCPYCVQAKQLLNQKGVKFEERNIEDKPEEYDALKKRTGLRTVPQIFIGDELIGGFTDMLALEQRHELDAKLGL